MERRTGGKTCLERNLKGLEPQMSMNVNELCEIKNGSCYIYRTKKILQNQRL